jgi:hypothetical protein
MLILCLFRHALTLDVLALTHYPLRYLLLFPLSLSVSTLWSTLSALFLCFRFNFPFPLSTIASCGSSLCIYMYIDRYLNRTNVRKSIHTAPRCAVRRYTLPGAPFHNCLFQVHPFPINPPRHPVSLCGRLYTISAIMVPQVSRKRKYGESGRLGAYAAEKMTPGRLKIWGCCQKDSVSVQTAQVFQCRPIR